MEVSVWRCVCGGECVEVCECGGECMEVSVWSECVEVCVWR